jgi:hypothetical protein
MQQKPVPLVGLNVAVVNCMPVILIAAVALALALTLAYLPMQLLVTTMTRSIRQLIERQRDRRRETRHTPDRRSPSS